MHSIGELRLTCCRAAPSLLLLACPSELRPNKSDARDSCATSLLFCLSVCLFVGRSRENLSALHAPSKFRLRKSRLLLLLLLPSRKRARANREIGRETSSSGRPTTKKLRPQAAERIPLATQIRRFVSGGRSDNGASRVCHRFACLLVCVCVFRSGSHMG